MIIIDDDGKKWEVVGYGAPQYNNGMHFVKRSETLGIRACDWIVDDRLLVKPLKRKVTTTELAREWADANPDVIVEFNHGLELKRASSFSYTNHGSDFGELYHVQVALGQFEPLSEQEI